MHLASYPHAHPRLHADWTNSVVVVVMLCSCVCVCLSGQLSLGHDKEIRRQAVRTTLDLFPMKHRLIKNNNKKKRR